MTKFLKIFAVLLLISGCGKPQTSDLIIDTGNGKIVYHVETATTKQELETGLMNRNSLPADGGMIFDLSQFTGYPTAMWMKDTKIPLDMLFVTNEGVIFYIYENAQPYSEEHIKSPLPAFAVVEINGGDVAKKNIKVGHKIKHPLFDAPRNNQEVAPAFVHPQPIMSVDEAIAKSAASAPTQDNTAETAPETPVAE